MVFLRRDDPGETRRLEHGRVYLRLPVPRDYPAWAALRRESRPFLTPWEPTWRPDELSRDSFRARLRRYDEDARLGRAFAFFTFRADDDALVGGATLSQVRRGSAQSATLGYWIGALHARRGYTTDAARALIRFAFDELGLHRLEAACIPENTPSKALLLRVGFSIEGQARAYLRINGAWRDHLLFGLVQGDEPL